MPPNSAIPRLVLGSDSPRAGAALPTPIKAAIHTNPSENGPGNIDEDRRYDVLDSPVNSKPPLSRNPTEVGTGIRIATPSSLQVSEYDISSGIQRSKTEAPVRASTPSQLNGPNPNKRRTRSYAEGGGSSRKSKQEPDLAAQITLAMDRMGEIGLDDPKSYLPDDALSGLITENGIKRALSKSSEKLIASSELINFAKTNSKVLAITVLVYSDKRSRYQAMEAFRSNGFGDHCLPVIMFSEKVCFVQFTHNDSDESDQSDDESEISEPLENYSEDESDILETSGAASEPLYNASIGVKQMLSTAPHGHRQLFGRSLKSNGAFLFGDLRTTSSNIMKFARRRFCPSNTKTEMAEMRMRTQIMTRTIKSSALRIERPVMEAKFPVGILEMFVYE
jgi:hypothetical protein